ncbi:MAG: MFS transporter [Chloroflexota bacterium]|nr:MFS transporter [Chloroflexota bacterium]
MDSDPPSETKPNRRQGPLNTPAVPVRHRVFYGWFIVAAATLASTIQSSVFNVGAQTLVLPLVREFNATRTAVSIAFSLRRLEGGLTGPIEGYLIHWIGPRRYMVGGWVIFGLGLIATGFCQNMYQFYLAFLLVTLGQSVAGFLPIVTVLINWFDRGRGRAIAIYQLGGSLGALLIPALAWLILNVGWRQTMIAVGITVIIVGVPLALVMRPNPEDYGYLPDGAEPDTREGDTTITQEGEATGNSSNFDSEQTISQALRSRNFWFLGLSHSAGITAWGALQVHQIPALVEIGIDELAAAGILSYTLVIAALGRLIGGFLGDIAGPKKVTALAFISQGISVVILAFATSLTEVMIFATVFGIAFGTRGTLMTVIRAEVFGRKNFSRLAGWMDPVSSVSVLISPIFAGLIYDSVGSYQTAFLVLAVVNASGALLLLGVHLPRRKERIQVEFKRSQKDFT